MHPIKIFGIIAIIAAASAIYFKTSSERPQVVALAGSYEKQARDLRASLLAGDYSTVEKYFQQAHSAGPLKEHGRNATYSILSTWFDSEYYLTNGTLQHINNWINAFPDSAFAYMARAEFHYRRAWVSRTERYAALIPESRLQGYYDGLALAHEDITKNVLPRNPSIAYAYERLIAIAAQTNGYFDTGEEIPQGAAFFQAVMAAVSGKPVMYAQQQKLLETAKANNIRDMFGIHNSYMFFSLAPQWGGSDESMLAYARAVSKDAPADSTLPMLRVFAHETIARGLSFDQKKAYYAQPGVWEELKWAYDRVKTAYPQGAQWMVVFAKTAYDAGKYHLSAELMNTAYYTDPQYTRTYREMGEIYMNSSDSYGHAEKAFNEFLAIRTDHPDPYYWLGKIRFSQGKYDEAIRYSEQGLAVDADNCSLLGLRCSSNVRKENYQQAIEICGASMEMDPFCKPLYFNRAKAFKALNKSEEAKADQETYDYLDSFD
ncbi:MAG: DUF4034 domain-containing protein [Alphaproteobacteria bacterium]